ncbi:MAG: TIGR03936 family radical SAM-associated protein [Eubacteriales bacterium]|nr:TIGR03936 family radical SAM-associated protein [Eubacteriales bacterium]
MKMLFVFRKDKDLRFIGHLDLQRAMQRALRRSGLPVSFSQGFNPHIILSFAAPLAVGITGEKEIAEIPLQLPVSPNDFLERLGKALPPGLIALEAVGQKDDAPAAMARLFAAQYTFAPRKGEEGDWQKLLDALPAFLARETIPYIRRTKSGERPDDLRPGILNLLEKNGELWATLALNQHMTAKPDQLLTSLAETAGIPVPLADTRRTALLDDRFNPLEQV